MAETRSTARMGETEEVAVKGRPLQKDQGTINVTYRPGPGDPEETEIFGKKMKAGESVEVDARFADKARGNPHLAVDGEKTYGDDKPQEQEPEEQPEASFEENLARERAKEYLEARPMFATSPPGEAERVARAQEQARELQDAADSDEKDDKPKRSRRKED